MTIKGRTQKTKEAMASLAGGETAGQALETFQLSWSSAAFKSSCLFIFFKIYVHKKGRFTTGKTAFHATQIPVTHDGTSQVGATNSSPSLKSISQP